jgi:sirohydrochlorin ferrochelatase
MLLVGHGTQQPLGVRQFLALAELVAQRLPTVCVEPAFLELQTPTIEQGLRKLIDAGMQQIVIVPALLFAAGHARHDVPAAVQAVVREFPTVEVRQAEHFGCHVSLLELSRRRYEQAIAGQGDIDAKETGLIMVGRGSRDDRATAEMHQFARFCGEQVGVAQTNVGFLAMAQPPLAQALEAVAARGFRRVVVQPHLLFAGDMQANSERAMRAVASRFPKQQWLLANVLGLDMTPAGDAGQLLVAAIVSRYEQAAASMA